jgi:hypothetical protein
VNGSPATMTRNGIGTWVGEGMLLPHPIAEVRIKVRERFRLIRRVLITG